jgi:ribosomal protein S18 acetylase RimI-like enzyme
LKPSVRVRPARGTDLLRIAELEAIAFPESWPVDLLAFELVHPQGILLVATSQASSQKEPPAGGYAIFRHGAGEAELLRIGVDPPERRRGLARALVADGLERLRREGVEVCHLEVRIHNHGAIALYEALGFERTGHRRGYYQDGTDALLYAIRL